MTSGQRGLYQKFAVYRADEAGGSEVRGCFILRPERDAHARAALSAYAESIHSENPTLASDIRQWLIDLTTEGQESVTE